MADTTLTRKEYLRKLKQLIEENPDIVAEIEASNPLRPKAAIQEYFESNPEFGLGRAKWRYKKGDRKITGSMPTASDPGERFILTSAGNNKLAMKSITAKNDNIKKSNSLRSQRLEAANNLIDPQKLAEGEAYKKTVTMPRNADHILEVQTFGPIMEQLEEELAAGAITKAEYNKRLQILKDANPGDHIDNFQNLHYKSNQTKKDIVAAKNNKLEAMETINPSARHMDPRYRDAMARRRAKMNNATNYTGLQVWSRQNGHNLDALKSGSLRKVDQYSNILFNAATGNYGGAALGAGFLGGSELLKDPKFQARIGKQIADLIGKRGKKTALKMIPGLDVVLSGQETLSYLRQGRLDQAGIALLSGAIGWIPVIGDAISASLDLTNTGLDIARLNFTNTVNRTGQPEIDPKTGRVFKI